MKTPKPKVRASLESAAEASSPPSQQVPANPASPPEPGTWIAATDPKAAVLRPGLPCLAAFHIDQINDALVTGYIIKGNGLGDNPDHV